MNNIIRQWLIEVLGYNDQHVIRANQEGPIPIGDFAIYRILSIVPSMYSIVQEADAGSGDDVLRTYYNKGELTVQVDVYASDGWSKQHNLTQSGYLLDVREILQPNYVSLIRSGSVASLTELVDTKFKDRFQCDHTFYVWNTIIETDQKASGYIITGKYQPGDETVVIDTTP